MVSVMPLQSVSQNHFCQNENSRILSLLSFYTIDAFEPKNNYKHNKNAENHNIEFDLTINKEVMFRFVQGQFLEDPGGTMYGFT